MSTNLQMDKKILFIFKLQNTELTRYKSLFVREKGRLETYTVLLLGANPPLMSGKQTSLEEF